MATKRVRGMVPLYDFTDIEAAGAVEAAAIAYSRIQQTKGPLYCPDAPLVVIADGRCWIIPTEKAKAWIKSHSIARGPAAFLARDRLGKTR